MLGHPYGPNPERGIYRSPTAARRFQRVLYKNDDVGAFDVAIDPTNPQRRLRDAVGCASGAVGDRRLVRDRGQRHLQIDRRRNDVDEARPTGCRRASAAPKSRSRRATRSGLRVCRRGRQGRRAGALYRSDDAGAHFADVNDDDEIAQRGDDLVSLAVDPRDPQTVYLTNTSTYRSTDGGKTIVPFKGAPGGDDYHDIWINPAIRDIIAFASRSGRDDLGQTAAPRGARGTTSRRRRCSTSTPTTGFRIGSAAVSRRAARPASRAAATGARSPQRDWHTGGRAGVRLRHSRSAAPRRVLRRKGRAVRRAHRRSSKRSRRSRCRRNGIAWFAPSRWPSIASTITAVLRLQRRVRHRERRSELAGHQPRFDARACRACRRVLGTFEADDPQHGDASRRRVRARAVVRARRHDLGRHRRRTSVDHARRSAVASVATGRTLRRPRSDPVEQDRADRCVATTTTRPSSPSTGFASTICARTSTSRATAARTGARRWTDCPMQPVNAVRQDPLEPRLLYAATENGVYVSFDVGAHWQSLQLDLPHTSVRDLIVHENDVVVATHGRGFWILDDVEPLRELARRGARCACEPECAPVLAGARVSRASQHQHRHAAAARRAGAARIRPTVRSSTTRSPSPAHRVAMSIYDASGRRRSPLRERRRRAAADSGSRQAGVLGAAVPARPARRRNAPLRLGSARAAAARARRKTCRSRPVPHDTPRVPEGPLVVPGRYTVRWTWTAGRRTRDAERRDGSARHHLAGALAAAVRARAAPRVADGSQLCARASAAQRHGGRPCWTPSTAPTPRRRSRRLER